MSASLRISTFDEDVAAWSMGIVQFVLEGNDVQISDQRIYAQELASLILSTATVMSTVMSDNSLAFDPLYFSHAIVLFNIKAKSLLWDPDIRDHNPRFYLEGIGKLSRREYSVTLKIPQKLNKRSRSGNQMSPQSTIEPTSVLQFRNELLLSIGLKSETKSLYEVISSMYKYQNVFEFLRLQHQRDFRLVLD